MTTITFKTSLPVKKKEFKDLADFYAHVEAAGIPTLREIAYKDLPPAAKRAYREMKKTSRRKVGKTSTNS